MKDFTTRLQSLSPVKQRLFELYLKNKGITDKEYQVDSSAQNQLITNDTDISTGIEQSGNDKVISDSNIPPSGRYENKELPFMLTEKITSFLARAFTLSIVLANGRMYPWYYQHFVQICSQTDDTGYTLLDFMEPAFPDDIIEEKFMGYAEFTNVPNIIDYVIEKLDADYYPVICVDEYYLDGKSSFGKSHFVHESMIYGYDNVNRKLLAAGFNADMLFDKLTFNYDAFAKAFEEGKKYYKKYAPYAERRAILLLLFQIPDEDGGYKFHMDLFLKDLKNYLFSIGDVNRVFLYATTNEDKTPNYGDEIKYGLAVYDVIIKKLEDLRDGKISIDYRAFHTVAEHKKVMYERLQYIMSAYDVDEITELCLQYLGIVEQFEDIRRKSLGISYSKHGFEKRNFDAISQIINTIKIAKEEEKTILTQVYLRLKHFVP